MKAEPTNLECYFTRNVSVSEKYPLQFKEHVFDGVGKIVFVFQFKPKEPGYIAEFTFGVRQGAVPELTLLSTRNEVEKKTIRFDGEWLNGDLDHAFSRRLDTCLPISLEELNQIAKGFSD